MSELNRAGVAGPGVVEAHEAERLQAEAESWRREADSRLADFLAAQSEAMLWRGMFLEIVRQYERAVAPRREK